MILIHSLFSWWVCWKSYQFGIFSHKILRKFSLKELAFSFIDLCYFFFFLLVSISFIPALIFIIYFLLWILDFVFPSFYSFFRYKVRLFETILSLKLRFYFSKLLIELLLQFPIGFGLSCFHCQLSWGIFLFPLWFLQRYIG